MEVVAIEYIDISTLMLMTILKYEPRAPLLIDTDLQYVTAIACSQVVTPFTSCIGVSTTAATHHRNPSTQPDSTQHQTALHPSERCDRHYRRC